MAAQAGFDGVEVCIGGDYAESLLWSEGGPAQVKAAADAAGVAGGSGGAGADPGVTELVVGLALLRVAENLVGLVDLGEPGGRVGCLVHIRMVLAGQTAISAADFIRRGITGDAQKLVVVLR